MAGIAEVWTVLKTFNWWKGLEAWHLVLILATLYLIWWVIDRYYNALRRRIDAVGNRVTKEEADRCAQGSIYYEQTMGSLRSIVKRLESLEDRAGKGVS